MADPLKAHWQALREPLIETWNGLTERDLDAIDGDREMLLTTLEQRYHVPRERLQWEVDELIGKVAGSEAMQDLPTAHHVWADAVLTVDDTE